MRLVSATRASYQNLPDGVILVLKGPVDLVDWQYSCDSLGRILARCMYLFMLGSIDSVVV